MHAHIIVAELLVETVALAPLDRRERVSQKDRHVLRPMMWELHGAMQSLVPASVIHAANLSVLEVVHGVNERVLVVADLHGGDDGVVLRSLRQLLPLTVFAILASLSNRHEVQKQSESRSDRIYLTTYPFLKRSLPLELSMRYWLGHMWLLCA